MARGTAMAAGRPGFDVFLSYNTRDRQEVARVRDFLRQRGFSTFLDAESLPIGQPWFPELQKAIDTARAVIVFVGTDGLGNWQQHEVAIAMDRQARERRTGGLLPVVPVLLPGVNPEDAPSFVRVNVWVQLTEWNDGAGSALDRLAAAIGRGSAETGPDAVARVEALCPYRGLHVFREEDAGLFFGRDKFANDLLSKALAMPLVAAVGPSGSGKSSVVQAGLLPRLRRQRPPDATWSAVVLTPGKAPFHNLAAALHATWKVDGTAVDRALEADKLGRGLADGAALDVAIGPALEALRTDKLLIVVDQFEELFSPECPKEDCDRFVHALLKAADGAHVCLALTLRADFYGKAIEQSRGLSDMLQQGQVNLGPMEPEELREAVTRPAEAAGLELEPGLVDTLLEDVRAQPGALPLLEFALTLLWERRDGRRLTNTAYSTMGGLKSPSTNSREAVFGTREAFPRG
jgi:hypothetical protein